MSTIIQILIGALACSVFILIARKAGQKGEVRIYAVGLVVAALIYVGFAVFGNASPSRLALEVGGLVLFSSLAVFGLKISLWCLVLGWAAHTGWDVLLHRFVKVEFVPEWYPILCVGFDLLLAAYIGLRIRPSSL